jgi:hypothetical protein
MSENEQRAREAIESVVQAQKEMHRAVMGRDPPPKVERKMIEEARRAAERRDVAKVRQIRFERGR